MANYGARLDYNLVTREAEDFVNLQPEDWAVLEGALQKNIPENARAALIGLIDGYLIERKFEVQATRLSQIDEVLTWLGTSSAAGIAEEDVLQRIFRHMSDLTIEVDLAPGAGMYGEWAEANEPRNVRLERRTAVTWARYFHLAVTKARAELSAIMNSPGYSPFKPGRSFDAMLAELRSWAESHGLPATPHNWGAGPRPFSVFAFELNRRLPSHLRETVASPDAMQNRLNAVAKWAKKLPV